MHKATEEQMDQAKALIAALDREGQAECDANGYTKRCSVLGLAQGDIEGWLYVAESRAETRTSFDDAVNHAKWRIVEEFHQSLPECLQ